MKQENIRHSLKWRLYVFISIFVGIIVFILWLFQIVLLDNFYRETKLKEVEALSNSLVYVLKNDTNADSIKSKVEKIMNSTNDSSSINVYLIKKQSDSTFIVLQNETTSETDSFKADLIVFANIWNTAKKENFNSFFIETSEIQEYKLHLPEELRFRLGNEIIFCQFYTDVMGSEFMLVLNSELIPMSAAKETLQIILSFVVGILLFVGIAIAFIMAKFISKPLEDLTKSAKQLAVDRTNLEFNAEGYQEVIDLSETLNYAVKEIQKSDKLQKELISNVSHELRTPLTLIAGYSEMMRDIPSEQTEENFNVIINETKRLSELVNDVLTLSKLQSNVQEVKYEKFSLTQVIEETINSFLVYCAEKNIKIIFDQSNQYIINANETQIGQVLHNFVGNAVNYSKDNDEEKEIIISVEEINDTLKVKVKDFGIGIKKSELENIWNRYYKVYDSQKKKSIGSGLGLAIVKQILETHNFEYGVNSEYSVGSEFWFIVPKENYIKGDNNEK